MLFRSFQNSYLILLGVLLSFEFSFAQSISNLSEVFRRPLILGASISSGSRFGATSATVFNCFLYRNYTGRSEPHSKCSRDDVRFCGPVTVG